MFVCQFSSKRRSVVSRNSSANSTQRVNGKDNLIHVLLFKEIHSLEQIFWWNSNFFCSDRFYPVLSFLLQFGIVLLFGSLSKFFVHSKLLKFRFVDLPKTPIILERNCCVCTCVWL